MDSELKTEITSKLEGDLKTFLLALLDVNTNLYSLNLHYEKKVLINLK
jgi:hypothetical protein